MTEPSLPSLVIVAPSPEAFIELCGVSLLDRTRRILRGLGLGEGTILSTPQPTVGEILSAGPAGNRIMVVFANQYCDGRLLGAVGESRNDSMLIDSKSPPSINPLWENRESHSFGRGPGAVMISRKYLTEKNGNDVFTSEILSDAAAGRIALIDAARQPDYLPDMRRAVRPVFFPAPAPELRPVAERLLINATQKGVLDFPALVHAPIEKWIVSHLCRTPITPNQITLGTGILGICVTFLYAAGHLWTGALLALAVGILDGVDGKLARLKVQMTKAGKAEHVLDYFVEMSWWAALAYHFQITGKIHFALAIWAAFYACDLSERIAKWFARQKIGRTLDDFSGFDRMVRVIAGRRNIYTWLFTFCLIIGRPAGGFVFICGWGITTAAVHIFRALQVRMSTGERPEPPRSFGNFNKSPH